MKKEADKMRRQAVAMQRRTAGADSLTTSCLILAAMNWILMSSVVGELVIKGKLAWPMRTWTGMVGCAYACC